MYRHHLLALTPTLIPLPSPPLSVAALTPYIHPHQTVNFSQSSFSAGSLLGWHNMFYNFLIGKIGTEQRNKAEHMQVSRTVTLVQAKTRRAFIGSNASSSIISTDMYNYAGLLIL